MRAAWMAGDFGVIAHTVENDAIAFAQRLAFPAGARVLDVATGTGNLALPIARAGAIVTGVDIAPNLLEQARQRAVSEGLTVQFDEGDAEALPYPDASFDAVVTMFGAMFAPRPERVAAELARVLRPGGTLAMANWTPGGFAGHMFAVGSRHAPPPPGPDGVPLPPPVLWGDPITVHQRLDGRFCDIRTERIGLMFDMPMSAAETVEHFRRYFGPTQAAFQRLDAARQEAFAADLIQLWSGANTAPNPEHHMLVPNEYLQVTARRSEA
ncbi:class I SAM-dependent methyltransferase [Terriglobus aquaticus]|uniref:Class I SAM-dependent methyltransferase n=1 Tax=Terriglobus aquaticus TaxID=940139 RepID=A0ABW9KPI4_9BACT|nr:class I SAM-dependent methyltransferase [Terriglobus aquaticus]